jgi:hypothetical protein
MTYYPIIIIPKPLQRLKSAIPQVPKFQEPQPRSPKTPQSIEIKLIFLETFTISGISLGLGLLNLLVGIGFLVLGFGAIAIQSLIFKSKYPDRLQQYEQDLKDYPHKLETYDRLKTEHNEEVQRILSPENITEFRQRQLLDVLKQTKSHNGTNSKAKRGMSEAKFAKYLRRYFEENIHERLTLSIPNSTYPYSLFG